MSSNVMRRKHVNNKTQGRKLLFSHSHKKTRYNDSHPSEETKNGTQPKVALVDQTQQISSRRILNNNKRRHIPKALQNFKSKLLYLHQRKGNVKAPSNYLNSNIIYYDCGIATSFNMSNDKNKTESKSNSSVSSTDGNTKSSESDGDKESDETDDEDKTTNKKDEDEKSNMNEESNENDEETNKKGEDEEESEDKHSSKDNEKENDKKDGKSTESEEAESSNEDDQHEKNEDDEARNVIGEKEDDSHAKISTSPGKKADKLTPCNRLLQSPLQVDDNGLPVPVSRPGLVSVPHTKITEETGCLCCCRGPSIKKLNKKAEQFEQNIGKNLQMETRQVLGEMNKYRKSVRTTLIDVRDAMFDINTKIGKKWEGKTTLDAPTLQQINDLLQNTMNKLKIDVDWLERLGNDLRNAESKPLTILGILHHLFQSNEVVLSLESNKLTRDFRGLRKALDFSTHIEKMGVSLGESHCSGTGIIRMIKGDTQDSKSKLDMMYYNANNSNGENDSVSDELDTFDIVIKGLLNILRSPTLLKRALKKIAKSYEKSEKNLKLEKGDESLKSTEDNFRTLITVAADLIDKVLSEKHKTNSITRISHAYVSPLSKSTKNNYLSSRSEAEKDTARQNTTSFHSCFDKTSFHTTLYNIDSLSSDGNVAESIFEKPDVFNTIVDENSGMFTANEFITNSNKLCQNNDLQLKLKDDKEICLRPKLIEVIHKVNQLARANNKVIKRIRQLERFVGKKSPRQKSKRKNKYQSQKKNGKGKKKQVIQKVPA